MSRFTFTTVSNNPQMTNDALQVCTTSQQCCFDKINDQVSTILLSSLLLWYDFISHDHSDTH